MAIQNPENYLDIIKREEEARKKDGQKELKEAVGIVTVKLEEPFEWCGVKYDEINMDFQHMTGENIEALEEELTALGIDTSQPISNKKYQRYLAARASGVPADMLPKLPIDIYYQITTAAQRFLVVTV
ncbi:MAG: hypothetical protein LUE11_04745 [Clostridia bacterium]|nr:hypothetical protein [Clostridia bacterium]